MPFVDFYCECGEEAKDEYFNRMSGDYRKKCKCGKMMKRRYTSTPFQFTFKAGFDHGLGEYVDTKKDRARIMREKGVHARD